MLINNSQSYIQNNTLRNNWLKQICRISQNVCWRDWTGISGSHFGTTQSTVVRQRQKVCIVVTLFYLSQETVYIIVIHRGILSFWCVTQQFEKLLEEHQETKILLLLHNPEIEPTLAFSFPQENHYFFFKKRFCQYSWACRAWTQSLC